MKIIKIDLMKNKKVYGKVTLECPDSAFNVYFLNKLRTITGAFGLIIDIEDDERYKELMIQKGDIVEMWGFKLQSIRARGNAWICAHCGRTPYVNHSETKQERDDVHDEPCPLALLTEEFDRDEYDSAPCSCDTIPISLYSDLRDWEITLCMQCAKDTGILEKMVG